MSSPKKIDLKRDFAAGVYQSSCTGDTVRHVCFFDPALWTVAPLTFSLVHLSPPFLVWISNQLTVWGGGGLLDVLGLRQITSAARSLYRSIFLGDDILHCLLWVLSFYASFSPFSTFTLLIFYFHPPPLLFPSLFLDHILLISYSLSLYPPLILVFSFLSPSP